MHRQRHIHLLKKTLFSHPGKVTIHSRTESCLNASKWNQKDIMQGLLNSHLLLHQWMNAKEEILYMQGQNTKEEDMYFLVRRYDRACYVVEGVYSFPVLTNKQYA